MRALPQSTKSKRADKGDREAKFYRLPAEAVLREEAAEKGLGGTRPGLSEKRH